MLLLFDFPDRYERIAEPANGSIDEVSWIDSDTSGTDAEFVPRGAALYVRGWALAPGGKRPADGVLISIDGGRPHEAQIGLDRPDVAGSLGDTGLSMCGFEALIPTGGLSAGTHRLEAVSVQVDARKYASIPTTAEFGIVGFRADLSPDAIFADGGCKATVDEIVDESRGVHFEGDATATVHAPRGATLVVRGWAYDERAVETLAGVFAIVDGAYAFRATYGERRADVGRMLDNDGLADVGYRVRIPTTALSRGKHRLEIVGVAKETEIMLPSAAGADVIVGESVSARIPLNESTAAFLDSVVRVERDRPLDEAAPLRVRRGDRVFVRGWAIDEAAHAPAAGVVLLLDETVEISAVYGLLRGDVAEQFGSDEFTRTGFSGEIATDHLTTGRHSVQCRVLARDGRGALRTAQRFDFEVSELA